MLMNVLISDKNTAKPYVQFFNQTLNISARRSWSISEILKTFKKLAVVYYQV